MASLGLPIGCIKPPSEAAARLERVRQEGAEMETAFDALEERLLGNSANLAMWQEMARRHQSVSEVACQNLDEHVKGMADNQERQENKAAGLKRRFASAKRVGGGSVNWSKLRN